MISKPLRRKVSQIIRKNLRKNRDTILPLSFLIEKHRSKNRTYRDTRDLKQINKEFHNFGIVDFNKIVNRVMRLNPNKKIKFLDVGAGQGKLAHDLEKYRDASNNPLFEYHGIDLKPKEIKYNGEKKLISSLDIQRERLQREQFNMVLAMNSFQYVGDKLRALENMINSLKVNGILIISPLGHIKTSNNNILSQGAYYNSNYNYYHELFSSIPNIKYVLSNSGALIILKTGSGDVNFKYDFVGASTVKEKRTLSDFKNNITNIGTELVGKYVPNSNRKSKW